MKQLSLIAFALLVAVSSAFAQDDLAEWAQMLKQDLRATKKGIISKGMITFTDEEAKRFWPIYDAYNGARQFYRCSSRLDQSVFRRLRQHDG
jgi:hypothetical protein